MTIKKLFKALSIFASSAIFSLSTMQSAFAALPGTLPDSPLFLSNAVEPNVFFTLDDSGSMDWGPMQDSLSGLAVSSGLPSIDGRRRAYYTPTFTNLYGPSRCYFVVPPFTNGAIPSWDASWVVRTHLSNRNYYNPSVKYEPWPGLDSNGDPLYDAVDDPTEVWEHPDITSGTGAESVNLATTYTYTEPNNPSTNCNNPPNGNASAPFYIPTYYTWPDNNNDGVVDARDIGDGDAIVEVSDLTTAEILAAEVQIQPGDTAFGIDQWLNFANWFQYHRSRMNSTKSIIGGTINKTDASRMGARMFNYDQLRDLATMRVDSNKSNLLEDLYEFVTQRRGTPARTSLKETWDYFADPGSGAILDQDGGGECQQNFNILMSDGFWNSNNSPGVGNADKNDSGSQKEGINPLDDPPVLKRFDGTPAQSVDGGNYADSWSNTLADVAMHNYEEDLSPLADRVPTTSVDLAAHQHLVTYTIAFGLTGSLPSGTDPLTTVWPQPIANTNTTVDDMWHAAYNGRGQYLSAQDPQALEASLDQAISDIAKRTATAAAVSINSAKLTTETIVYLAEFNSNGWQGNLYARKIKTDANGNLDPNGELEPGSVWDAAGQLNSPGFDHSTRVVMTHDGSQGIPFKDFDDLNPVQQADLKTNSTGGIDSDTIAQARLDHLRGSRDNEGTGYEFRQRLSLLSDLVNSGPVFIGPPDLRWPDKAPFPEGADRYSDFKNGPDAGRQAMVYTGSNGGFMHGFDADTGEEKIAYVASNLFSTNPGEGLHYLTDPNYKHKFYNDLTPTVSDIFDGANWQTVLISGQRGGGRGIFALDVTNPAKFTSSATDAADVVMWEFTNADDDDLGYSYSRPQIGLANDGSWVAIFGNGYNDTGDGRAKLFILKIHQGLDGTWTPDTDYVVIDTGAAVTTNGLATPALADLDGNGTIDRAYAGDLEGKMWAFDLSDTNSDNWDVSAQPLFTTLGNRPITAQPTLSRHPTESTNGSNEPNIMVFFGSGQWLAEADKFKPVSPATYPDEYFYGVWDKGPLNTGLIPNDLVQQTYETGFGNDPNGFEVRVLSRNPVDYAGGSDYGWYFILPDDGERSVTRPVVRGDVVFFNTYVPESDPCEPQGYGYRMAVDIITGGSPENPTFDVDMSGEINDSDRVNNGGTVSTVVGLRQEGFLPEPVFIEDIAYTAETPAKVAKLKKIPKGRFSWQELIQ